MPYLTPDGGQPVTIPRRSKAATDKFKASRDPNHTTRPAHYLPTSTLKPLTSSTAASPAGSLNGGPSGVGSASGGRPRSRSDLTPRPSGSQSGPSSNYASSPGVMSQDDGGVGAISAALAKSKIAADAEKAEEENDETRRDSTPSLSSHAASASSVSVQSLNGEGESSSDHETAPSSVSISHTNSEDAVVMSLVGTDRNEAVRRYTQELYTFHRKLLEEAKQDAEGAPRRGSFSQFGERQSGMAKLAAKKALASRLNA